MTLNCPPRTSLPFQDEDRDDKVGAEGGGGGNMASTSSFPITTPVPIYKISSILPRYMLYDIDTITYLRREHHILGVLAGTLPQVPQQNVFLGLPLQLMPEEAKLLVEKGIAYIVDDTARHRDGLYDLDPDSKSRYMQGLRDLGERRRKDVESAKTKKTIAAREKLGLDIKDLTLEESSKPKNEMRPEDEEEGLFSTPPPSTLSIPSSTKAEPSFAVTPTSTSAELLPLHTSPDQLVPVKSSSYALFKHLHSRNYFMTPGLRFGCEFTAYPGDPLRYHSHFLAVGYEWDEEFDLLDLVGGGRLGTGVKKGWLIGGEDPSSTKGDEGMRVFSVEWAGM